MEANGDELEEKNDEDIEVVKEVEVISMEDDQEDLETEGVSLSETPLQPIPTPEESPQASTSKTFVPKCYLCNTWFQDMEFLKKHTLKWHANETSDQTTTNTAQSSPESSNPVL